MISTFELNYNLSDEMNGTVLQKETLTDRSSFSIPLYIKTIMANISQGTPSTSVLSTAGSSIFKCANRKPALTSQVLTQQNYISASIYKDGNAEDINKTTELLTDYLQTHIDRRVHSISTKKINYVLAKNTTVRVNFLNGKLSKLAFSLTNSSSSTKKLK